MRREMIIEMRWWWRWWKMRRRRRSWQKKRKERKLKRVSAWALVDGLSGGGMRGLHRRKSE